MDAIEKQQRELVVAEARSWLRTPWRHQADVKGKAVDCAMLLVRCFVDTGMIAPFDPRPYPKSWMLHRDEERFLGWVEDKLGGVEVDAPQIGDVLVYKVGRCYSHGAILVAPQLVCHAYIKDKMVLLTETFAPELADRKVKYFDMWARKRALGVTV